VFRRPRGSAARGRTFRVKMDCRFRPFEHVRLKREFDRVFQEGRAFELREIMRPRLPNGLGHPRLGLCVGKRHGNAVRRNRIKRLLREAYRLNRHTLAVRATWSSCRGRPWRNLTLTAIEPVFREALSRIGRSSPLGSILIALVRSYRRASRRAGARCRFHPSARST